MSPIDVLAVSAVALRKESVDRNLLPLVLISLKIGSLSARRAWIEILNAATLRHWACVALRKESVDRNTSIDNLMQGVFKSLSARRAWIEMRVLDGSKSSIEGRSPQGERG